MAKTNGDGSIILTTEVDESGINKFSSGIGRVGKTIAAGLAVAVAGFGALSGAATKSYADYEQLIGGVETLFKGSADIVEGYANQAYQTAGLSANKYMETVTGFSASLLQSLGGDTAKAAEYSNQAVIDMSDNVNKMGTNIEMIQYAYQGFAKQNYTMLDNLKLGYGGTKEEMQRLLEDAEKISGIHYDISSFADVTQAIHVMQTELGITGTTANEAATTIQGSASAMKSSWQNLLTGIADPTQDFEALVNNFVNSVQTFGNNIMPVIENTIDGVFKLIIGIIPMVPSLIQQIFPAIIGGITSLINGLVTTLPQFIDGIMIIINGIVQALPSLINTIVSALPNIIPVLVNGLVSALALLVTMMPQIIQPIIDNLPAIILSITQAIIDNLPILIEGAIKLVIALVAALPSIISALLEAVGGIALQIGETLFNALPGPVQNAFKQAWESVKAIWDLVEPYFSAIWNAIKSIFSVVGNVLSGFFSAAWTIIKAVWDAVSPYFSAVWESIKAVFSVVSTFLGGAFSAAWAAIKAVWDTVTGYFKVIWDTIATVFSVVKDVLLGDFSAAWDAIKELLNTWAEFFGKIWGDIKLVFSTVKDWFKDTFSAAWGGIKEAFSNVKEFFEGVWAKIKNAFNFSEMIDIGRNIVKGLWNGINNMTSWIGNKIKSFCSNALGAIKGFFGIHSPSRVFRDEIGKNLMLGMAQGITKNEGKVTSSLLKVSQGLANTKFAVPNIIKSGVTPYFVNSVGASIGTGTSNTQQNEIENVRVIKEEHYHLNQTELMKIIYKLAKGGERINGISFIN